jgi:RimJ/RimL family protein N-acetyltransferase
VKRTVFDKDRVNEWVSERLGKRTWSGNGWQAIGIEAGGELVGGVVFDAIAVGERCSIHCVGTGKHWLTRNFLKEVFHYAFNVCKSNVVISPVDSDNAASIRFIKHIGFKELARVAGGAGANDLVLFTLHRADCRWIGAQHE